MYHRACIFGAVLLLASPAFAQNVSDSETTTEEKLQPLTEPGAETRPADQKASSVKFEVQSGFDLGTDESGRVIVESVKAKGDAATAGVKEGDHLLAIDDTPINSAVSLSKFLKDQQDVNAHILKLRRGEKEFEVTLGKKVDLLGMTIFSDQSQRPLVRRLEKGSPADRAGIRRGDLISGLSGREIETINQFEEIAIPLIRKMSEGQEIPMRLVRDGDTIDVDVIRPEDAALPLIPAPKEMAPRPAVTRKERVIHKHTMAPVQVDDNDETYLGGLSGMQGTTGGGSGLALDFSNTGTLNPFTEVTAVSAMLHHVNTTTRAALSTGTANTGTNGTNNNANSMDSMMGHSGNAGFVLVQMSGNQAVVNARLAGFAPGQYRLAVYEFGDCGDVMNGSAGQGALELGTFAVDRSGRGNLQTAVAVNPQALLGRVVAVTPLSANQTNTTTPNNTDQPLNQSIRSGNLRNRQVAPQNNQNAVPNGGQAAVGSNVPVILASAESSTLLAQAPKVNAPNPNPRTPLDDTPGQPDVPPNPAVPANPANNPANPAARGANPGLPLGDDTPGQPDVPPNTPNNPNVPNTGNGNNGFNNLTNLNNTLNNSTTQRTLRNAREACGVFGFSNPQRPILPFESGNTNNINNNTINNNVPNNTNNTLPQTGTNAPVNPPATR